jgi:hypothetical protein
MTENESRVLIPKAQAVELAVKALIATGRPSSEIWPVMDTLAWMLDPESCRRAGWPDPPESHTE